MSENNHDRRDFLKAGTAAAAGAALAGLAPYVHAAGSDTIKVGIIGCGGRGTGAGGDVLQAAPNVEIVAIGDVFKFRVQNCRRRLQDAVQEEEIKKLGNKVSLPDDRCFAGLDCHDKVLNSGANYIILASPPGFRPTHLQAAVAAGKNIFTEKPVGVDGPGIRKVLAAYEDSLKKGLGIAAGTQRRHQNSYLETMKRVHGGEIGDVVALRCHWDGDGIWFRKRDELRDKNEPTSDLAFQLHNWYHFVWTCGDHIVEQHVHNLDVCNWAMKKHPLSAVGYGSRTARPAGPPQEAGHIFDQFAINFDYGNGVHMLSTCRHIPGSSPGDVSEHLVGTKGFCDTKDPSPHTIQGMTKWTYQGPRNKPYVQEHTDLIASIRDGKPINELRNVAESTLTAILGRMSAYTGKKVTWEQALNSKEDTMPEKLAWDMSLPVPAVAVPGKTKLV